jgi:hypothetical protein
VIGEKNVVDIELRVGFITSHTKEFTKKLKHYRDITNLILSEERPFFAINHSVPPIFATYQPFAFGPNVYWTTRGERDEKEIMAHTNAVIDVAMTSSFPLLKKMFGPVISEHDFKKATLLDNSLHELGHLLATRSDGAIHERIGDSAEVSIAEELKADSGDMKLVMMAEHTLNNNSVNPTHQLLAKIGDILDYLKNKSPDPGTSGERYYYDGLIIIIRLFQEGCLFEEQGLYHIKDSRRAIEVIAHINDELTEIYLKKEEEELKRYIKINQEKKIDERVQRFITALLRK